MDFQNRQYDPQLGRFLSFDPMADAAGRQGLSPYHAMACNPSTMVDPLGLAAQCSATLSNPNVNMAPAGLAMVEGQPIMLGASLMGGGVSDMMRSLSQTMDEAQHDKQIRELWSRIVAAYGNVSAANANNTLKNPIISVSASGNATTQQKVLFFKSEKLAYNYIVANTTFPLDKNYDVPRPVENFAFVTKDGVYVLPINGKDVDGEEFRNYGNSAEWRIMNYNIDENGMSIQYNDKWSKVIATVHTHPGVASGGNGSTHSSADQSILEMQKTMSIVFSANGQAYGMVPGGPGPVLIAPHSEFRNGTISIINHYKYLRDFLKQ